MAIPLNLVKSGYICCRGDSEIQPTFKLKMAQEGEICTLQMSGVTLKMSGEYRCLAVNSEGETVCTATVSVVGEYRYCFSGT